MRVASYVVALLVAGCGRAAPTEPAASTSAPRPVPSGGLDPWSRGAPAGAGQPGAPPIGSAVPAALAEILDHVPRPPAASAAPGPTRLGTPTHLPDADHGAAATADASPPATATASSKPSAPEMATPSIERECRAQVYWPLVDRCRDTRGAILPPEVVTLHFLIDSDGAIVSSSIQATATDARWDAAAECMRRELSALPFHAPASVRGAVTRVAATVPSID